MAFDILPILEASLRHDDWGSDGLLHASTDLVGPLRHTMLRMAGAPAKPKTWVDLVTLETGTMFHKRFQDALEAARLPVMREVRITEGLPEGWSGTADTLIWDADLRAFVLYDYKTQRGEGMRYIEMDGAKRDHVWQSSAYWHALAELGYPIYNRVKIIYIPKNQPRDIDEPLEPIVTEVKPLPRDEVWEVMNARKAVVDDYLESLTALDDPRWDDPAMEPHVSPGWFLTPELAPPMPRQQKLMKAKDAWNVVLVPHWTSMFCPYSSDLCDCGHDLEQHKTTKIGHFVKQGGEWVYEVREGYELVEPEVQPVGKVRL